MTARETLLEKVEEVAKQVDDFSPAARAKVLVDLALAFRYLTGGPQPGGGTIEKS